MAKSHLALVSPPIENRTVTSATPLRRPNSELRTREFMTPAEIDTLVEAAKASRWGHRDATMILICYRHGFRVSELIDLRWDEVDFDSHRLHVQIPVHRGQSFRRIADSVPVIADSFR